ncbi:putative bifunctional diguanylate cyclase/phosphodiesterase [Rhizobium leguminosarum]|uniref:putative bifunctional diguanylate cyclase/phosphodiesterase n=1 Tax=Rhizobium leguminosarum TaxID=384 RepID=UPI003F984C8A
MKLLSRPRNSFSRAEEADGIFTIGKPAARAGRGADAAARRQTDQRLTEALEFAEGIIAVIPDILFEMDLNGRYLQVWTKHPETLAATEQQLLGKTIDEMLPPDEAAAALHAIREADEKGASGGHTIRIPQQNGEPRWFEHYVAKRPGGKPSPKTFLMLSRDITERKHAEQVSDEARTQLLTVLQTIPDMVWLKDIDGVYLLCNHAFERLVGKLESEIVGKTDFDLFGADVARFFREKDLAAIRAGGVLVNEEWVTRADSGEHILLETRKVGMIGAEGKTTGVLGVGRDITELNASREKIHRMAFFDSLTSLPNRALFYERLGQLIIGTLPHYRLGAVMMIDLDHFKTVNDTMGHPVGDDLLFQAARRLQEGVRGNDTVARLGGDEFAILLPGIRHGEELANIANMLLETFNEPFDLNGKEVFVSCSIGIARYPDDSTDANDLVKYADSAMYSAKRSGRGSFRFYSKELTASAKNRLLLESELRRAIERGELEVHYQPKVLLGSGIMTGSEALLRWCHREMGMVPPATFIPIAEETGLIVDLGRWVLREACQTAAELNANGQPSHKVAINFSSKQFQRPDLVAMVAEILAETVCRPAWIEIEITESLLLDEKNETLATLSTLRTMGISIAIDDFGTGYSALSYLARFPIDTLKIDRSFINSDDERSAELVKAILSIARCLGQSVIAEGVETVEQAAFLAANGCNAAQGFLFSKPVPKREILKLPQYLNVSVGSAI